jgi:hypothetical protein
VTAIYLFVCLILFARKVGRSYKTWQGKKYIQAQIRQNLANR